MSKKKEVTKKEITANQYGRNIVMVIEGEKYSKAFIEKADRDRLLEEAVKYNKRPSNKRRDELIKELSGFVDNPTIVAKPKKKAKPKAAEVKTLTNQEEIEKAQKLLKKHGYNVEKAGYSPTPRRGEH